MRAARGQRRCRADPAPRICVQPDYAFADPSVTGSTELQDFLIANDGAAFPFCWDFATFSPNGVPFKKEWKNQTNTFNDMSTDLTQLAFGFDGQFGNSTWVWDAYYQYGESERTQIVNDKQHLTRGRFGLDAVIDPATGQPAYRYDLPSLAEDPVNGVEGGGDLPTRVDANSALANPQLAFTTSGEVADGFGAGPIRAAVGLSYRSESIENLAAEQLPDYERLDFLIQYGESFGGEVDVTELFGEIDVPFTDNFSVNAAFRESEYKNSAGFGTGVEGDTASYDISTHKVSANWDVIDSLRIRLSRSKDIRAPNFRELYYGQVFTPGGLFGFVNLEDWFGDGAMCSDYQTGNVYSCDMDPAAWTLAGGLDVLPEEADTDTIGFVITPPNSNLRFAADYYQIDLTEAITPASINLVLDQCFNRVADACALINRDLANRSATFIDPNDPLSGFTDIVTIRAEAFNYRSYEVKGVDLTADYLLELDSGATMSFRLIASATMEQIIQPNTEVPTLTRNIAGVTDQTNGFLADWAAAPDWTANLTATYSRGPFAITGQMQWIDEGKNDATWVGPDDPAYADILRNPDAPWVSALDLETASDNTVPSYTVFNVTGRYTIDTASGNTIGLFATIDNLLDTDPPLLGTGTGGTNPIFFDTVGRTYRLGLTLDFGE